MIYIGFIIYWQVTLYSAYIYIIVQLPEVGCSPHPKHVAEKKSVL
jgi:hypothetical protein